MINRCRRLMIPIISMVIILALTSCKSAPAINTADTITTQTHLSNDKISLTVLVKNAFTINTFEKAVEEKFPKINIIQVGNYTSNMGTAEYKARLKNDDLTDIVMTWPLGVAEEYWPERLIDLSTLPIANQYNTSRLNEISRDGSLYYLPGPSQLRGIIYNKTLFEENGYEVPTDFDSFTKLCQTIEKSGIRSLQLGLLNGEVIDTAFIGFNYGNSFSKPKDEMWISDYNNSIGNFGDHFDSALNTFQKLIDFGVLKKEDLTIDYAKREEMLFNRQCAMVEDSVLMARTGESYNGCTDEFAMMPFFGEGKDSDWARIFPICYIGLNKHLEESKNKEKYDAAIELLNYISTVEGQKTLMGDTGAMISALNDVPPPDIPEIEAVLPAIAAGRCAIFSPLKNSQNALRKGLSQMITGEMTKTEVMKIVDKQNVYPTIPITAIIIGKATADFSLIETGNFVTDTMRETADTDIALFLDNGKDGTFNGKGISGRIYEGDISPIDVKRIIPDVKLNEKGVIWKVKMTGANLIKTLEESITVGNGKSGWFYYFSGLRMEYDPCAKPGERIKQITDGTGKKINSKQVYSVAIMDQTIDMSLVESYEETSIMIGEMLISKIVKLEQISPSLDGRFVVSN